MRFFTEAECQEYVAARAIDLPRSSELPYSVTVWYPPNPASLDLKWIARNLSYREPILLWITEWGIWPSSENWHLYYKLRQSYRDNRLLYEAPGHLFLDYERDDLASFLQVAMTNGWGGHLLPPAHEPCNAFFSHDEYIDFYASEDLHLNTVRERFADLLEPPASFHSAPSQSRVSADGEALTPTQVHLPNTSSSK